MLEIRCELALEEREGGSGRIRGTILPIGRIAGDRREVFTPGSVSWPAAGVRLLAEHRGRQVMRFTPIERAGNLEIDEQLPDSDLGREVAGEIRSGKRSGLVGRIPRDRGSHGARRPGDIRGAGQRRGGDSLASLPASACRGPGEYQASAGADVAVGHVDPCPAGSCGAARSRTTPTGSSGTTSRVRRPAGVRGAATAGLQIAAGTLGRALATATVEGDRGALDPHVLEGVGTDLVRSGRFLGLLRVDQAGRVRLLRAGAVASVVYGEADPGYLALLDFTWAGHRPQ